MELVKLNDEYQAGPLIENYDSLIWSERFNTVGDFQLVTGDVGLMEDLPEGSTVALRESDVPMIVETHQITRKKNEAEKLMIRGRAFESVLDRRASVNGVGIGTSEWTVNVKTPSDAAYFIIYKVCVEGIADPLDIFPPSKFQVTTPADYLASTGPVKPFVIPRGNLLSTVLTLLQTEAGLDVSTTPDTPPIVQHGIRSIRPGASGTAIGILIYTGEDKSDTVYFDATRDLLDDGTYLFSKIGSATDAYILGQTQSAKMSKGDPASGFERRVILVDATNSSIDTEETLREQGSMSLAQAHETALFDGSINKDLSPYIFGVDYNLGDIVKVVGDYGLEEKARVTEYIRTHDATGIKAYPTLSTLTSSTLETP